MICLYPWLCPPSCSSVASVYMKFHKSNLPHCYCHNHLDQVDVSHFTCDAPKRMVCRVECCKCDFWKHLVDSKSQSYLPPFMLFNKPSKNQPITISSMDENIHGATCISDAVFSTVMCSILPNNSFITTYLSPKKTVWPEHNLFLQPTNWQKQKTER